VYADDDLLGRALDEFGRQLSKGGRDRNTVGSPLLSVSGTGETQDFKEDANASEPNLFAYDRDVRRSLVLSELRGEIKRDKYVDEGDLRKVVAEVASIGIWEVTGPKPSIAAEFFSLDLDRVVDANEATKGSRRRSNQLPEFVVQHHEAPIFMLAAVGATSETHPYTVECLDAAAALIDELVHPLKHDFNAPRPAKRSPRIVPLLQAPTHFSFPSGHATYSYCAAELLASLCGTQFSNKGDLRSVLQGAAELISDNRVVAGLHYPCDSDAGRAVGYALGRWLVGQGSLYQNDQSVLAKATYVASKQNNKWKATLTYGTAAEQHAFKSTVRWRALMYRAALEWKA
jgi:hypothetical protein